MKWFREWRAWVEYQKEQREKKLIDQLETFVIGISKRSDYPFRLSLEVIVQKVRYHDKYE